MIYFINSYWNSSLMRHTIRAGSFILTVIILLSFVSTTQAAGYFVNFTLRGGAYCDKTGAFIPETFDYNIPAGTTLTQIQSLNGTVLGINTVALPFSGSGSGSAVAGASFPTTNYPYTFVASITFNFAGSGTYTDTFTLVCNNGVVVSVSVKNGNGSSGGGSGPIFDDGRLNMDALETAAIYCLADGSVRVYVPGSPLWTIAFDASPAEIASVATKPLKNTLIKSGKGAFLYRLTSGELQINSSNNYVFIFKDCPKPQ